MGKRLAQKNEIRELREVCRTLEKDKLVSLDTIASGINAEQRFFFFFWTRQDSCQ